VTWALTLASEPADGARVVRVKGRLGTATSGALIEALVTAIDAGERCLVLDLSDVDYASSAGLLALDAVSGRMELAGGRFVLCGLMEPVRMAFDLAGLLPHFTIAPSREAALLMLAQTSSHSPNG
jgi:stage II sporulation protein AA (anti-sigma F factor antagonist)